MHHVVQKMRDPSISFVPVELSLFALWRRW